MLALAEDIGSTGLDIKNGNNLTGELDGETHETDVLLTGEEALDFSPHRRRLTF